MSLTGVQRMALKSVQVRLLGSRPTLLRKRLKLTVLLRQKRPREAGAMEIKAMGRGTAKAREGVAGMAKTDHRFAGAVASKGTHSRTMCVREQITLSAGA